MVQQALPGCHGLVAGLLIMSIEFQARLPLSPHPSAILAIQPGL
jgi:hypothetical protein